MGAIAVDAQHTTACIFLGAVVHRFVRRKVRANLRVELAFIGMQPRLGVYVLIHDLGDRRRISGRRVERAHLAAALDQRNDSPLRVDMLAVLVRTALRSVVMGQFL